MNCTVREMRAGLLYKMGMTKTAEDLRYPIGRFRALMPVTSELRAAAIDAIAGLPDRMRPAVADLTDENAWALLADMKLPVSVSLGLIDSVHARWAAVYHAMTVEEFERAFVHPEIGAQLTLDWHLQQYAWHSHHHLAHITELRRTKGW